MYFLPVRGIAPGFFQILGGRKLRICFLMTSAYELLQHQVFLKLILLKSLGFRSAD